MKAPVEQLSLDEYAYETHRKDQLLDLFSELEEVERTEKRSLPFKIRKYNRIIHDHGIVKKVNESSVMWIRENGEKIEIPLTKKICDLLLVGDMLILAIGKRQKVWRLMNIIGIVNEVDNRTLASFAVPKSERPKYLN